MEADALISLLICGTVICGSFAMIPVVILVAVLKKDTDKDVDTSRSFKLDRQKEIN